MENKLQKLTEKLYNEGLSKGRHEADELLQKARTDAAKIVADAHAQAQQILDEARKSADELTQNTQTEVALAARQTVGTLKQQIQTLVTLGEIAPAVAAADRDALFVKNVILETARRWNPDENTDLTILLPKDTQADFLNEIEQGIRSSLNKGVEVKPSERLKSGFKIGPQNGSYFISFTDEDYVALFSEYLRPKVSEMIFGK